jgi:hypothetical protein
MSIFHRTLFHTCERFSISRWEWFRERPGGSWIVCDRNTAADCVDKNIANINTALIVGRKLIGRKVGNRKHGLWNPGGYSIYGLPVNQGLKQ